MPPKPSSGPAAFSSAEDDALMELNCEITRLKTLLEYKEFELTQIKQKDDEFGFFECFNGLRQEFDHKMKNLEMMNEALANEASEYKDKLVLIEGKHEAELEARRVAYE